VYALSVFPEEAEELDFVVVGGAETVRGPSVELRRLPGR